MVFDEDIRNPRHLLIAMPDVFDFDRAPCREKRRRKYRLDDVYDVARHRDEELGSFGFFETTILLLGVLGTIIQLVYQPFAVIFTLTRESFIDKTLCVFLRFGEFHRDPWNDFPKNTMGIGSVFTKKATSRKSDRREERDGVTSDSALGIA